MVKFYSSEFSKTAMKFCEKLEYAQEIVKGNIYMKECGYFRYLEDTFRGDPYDGVTRIVEEYKKIPFTFSDGTKREIQIMNDDIYGLEGDDKFPIFCSTLFDENIITPLSDSSGVFCKEFLKEISQFGKYVACFSIEEFEDKALDHAFEKDLFYQFGRVAYLNCTDVFPSSSHNVQIDERVKMFWGIIYKHTGESIEGGILFQTESYALFQKDPFYRWQNEWRFVLLDKENILIPAHSDYYVMSIGSFSSGRIYEINDIVNATIEFNY